MMLAPKLFDYFASKVLVLQKKERNVFYSLCTYKWHGQTDCYEQFFNKKRISIMRGLVLGNMPVLNAYT